MGRCGGFYGGCGPCLPPPCGGGYYNDNYGVNNYADGFNNNCAADSCGGSTNDVVCNENEVFYKREKCYRSHDDAYCGNRYANNNCGCNNGCGSYGGSNGGNYGGYGGGCGGGYGGGYGGGCGDAGYGPDAGVGFPGCSAPRRAYGSQNKFGKAPAARLHKNLGHNQAKKTGYWSD